MTVQPVDPGLSRGAPGWAVLARLGLILLAAALALAATGPFGTHVVMGFGSRIAYWLLTVAAIGGPIGLVLWALHRHVFGSAPPWWVPVSVAALAALPGTLVVEAALGHWAPMALEHVGRPEIAGQVLLLNLIAVAVQGVLQRALAARRPQPAFPAAIDPACPAPHPAPALPSVQAPAPVPAAPFADRLPPALAGARLLALQAEDHYLRFHTTAGQSLIHMRLSEAVARLGCVQGLQVHRSHWVARAALAGVERRDGRLMLRLEGGLLVPVSRSFRPRLAQEGWLGPAHEPVRKSESA